MSEPENESQDEVITEEAVEERDYLSEAKLMGYHDPTAEDYKGDPEKALSPEEFVRRGEEILPIVNANNKKLMAQNKKMQEDFDHQKAEMSTYMEATLNRERAEHKIQLKQAEDDQDFDRYKNLTENPPAEPSEQPSAKKSPIEIEFESRHDWYGVDEKRTKLAHAADRSLVELRPILTKEEYADRLEQEMERLMPTKQTHNTVTSARKKIGGTKTTESFEAMPKEYQDACQKMEKNQWGIKREDYVKNYYAGQR